MTGTTVVSLPAPRDEVAVDGSSAHSFRAGPHDDVEPADLLPRLTAHGKSMGYSDDRHRDLKPGAQGILEWLSSQPGDGWQQRWVAADADSSLDWLDTSPKGSCAGVARRGP
ncbi:hypothetical protein ACFVWZ_16125 [Streptomyces sp. NPDC058200]|uniref:hypothetical protein n=1 Tax=Streptomyces sp. NPDC058200 TaxID=3346378 RepID=UPI0036E20E36